MKSRINISIYCSERTEDRKVMNYFNLGWNRGPIKKKHCKEKVFLACSPLSSQSHADT